MIFPPGFNKVRLGFYFLLCFFSFHFLNGQTGKFFINNFSPVDYSGSDQNWCSVQDELGRIFIANSDGVYLYDGKEWKKIPLAGMARAVSLAKNDSNVIFAGGTDEFGFLIKKEDGKIEYRSLSCNLPEKDKGFENIWNIRCVGEDVFFCSNTKLFRLRNGTIKVFNTEEEKTFHTFFKAGYHLFIREKNTGFKICVNDELKFLPGSEIFADPANRVDFILPKEGNKFWVGSRNLGMFILSYNPKDPLHSTFEKFESPVNNWMAENQLYCAAKVNDHVFALGSLNAGVLLTDKNFNPVKKIDFNTGLQDDAVKHIHVDFNGNLWLSLNFGVSFVEINTPVTRWTKQNGIRGTVESAVKFRNRIYIANDKGVQVLDTVTDQFIETEISSPAWNMLEFDNSIFVAANDGLIRLKENGKADILYDKDGPYLVYKYPYDSKTFFLGMSGGIIVGKYENGKFTEQKVIDDWGTVKWAAAEENGNIAFGTTDNGVYIFDPENNTLLKNLDTSSGLPSMIENTVFAYNNKIYIGTDNGIYKIKDEHSWECILAAEFPNKDLNPITKAKQINEDVWFQVSRLDHAARKRNELSVFVPEQSDFVEDNKMLLRIKGIEAKDFFLNTGKVYISTNDGLYCYDITTKPNMKHFYTFISYMMVKRDTIAQNISFLDSSRVFKIPFSKNEILMAPAASDFFDKSDLEFAWYLEGKDSSWGAWQKTNLISYNNLREGAYILHVKSLNILGQEGNPIRISFTVSPPWYRSIIAYVLYVISGILLIWLIVALNLKRLKAANIRLEKIITERTSTIVEQKAEIEHKNLEITDSINYAKRIQNAILPDIEEIKKNWKNTFVFFQPKDIVSGDFFWWRKINEDEFYIAVADCTGHGVPGGFMCMICSDKLHEGAKISTTPDGVLFHANNAIKETLKQGTTEGGGNKDGMEIAMLKVNKKTREVQFSGANRFLWIIKDNSEEIIEIKPTKASIASTTDYNFKYCLHTVQLAEGDQLYMSSDGYADQFGGEHGKKFMTKNFKSLILSLREESIKRQGELLKENINNWMKGHEQVDDLLVIGLKL